MFDSIVAFIQNNDIVIITIKLFVAVLCGGIIGSERTRKRRPAGFRTHILVCIGSTLAMITNQYIFDLYGGDPSRFGAQVISGIGFLGAGTIMMTGQNRVKGLTTAAGLWASACMGLAIGAGFFNVAIISCIFIWFANVVLHNIDNFLTSKSRYSQIYVEFETSSYITEFLTSLREHDIKVSEMEIISPITTDGSIAATFTVTFMKKYSIYDQTILLNQIQGQRFLEIV